MVHASGGGGRQQAATPARRSTSPHMAPQHCARPAAPSLSPFLRRQAQTTREHARVAGKPHNPKANFTQPPEKNAQPAASCRPRLAHLDVSPQHASLDCRAHGHDLVGVDALGGVALEDLLDDLGNLRAKARRACACALAHVCVRAHVRAEKVNRRESQHMRFAWVQCDGAAWRWRPSAAQPAAAQPVR